METKIVEYNELIAIRVPPSDRWELVEDKNKHQKVLVIKHFQILIITLLR